jgi:hypothetical protein
VWAPPGYAGVLRMNWPDRALRRFQQRMHSSRCSLARATSKGDRSALILLRSRLRLLAHWGPDARSDLSLRCAPSGRLSEGTKRRRWQGGGPRRKIQAILLSLDFAPHFIEPVVVDRSGSAANAKIASLIFHRTEAIKTPKPLPRLATGSYDLNLGASEWFAKSDA